MNLQNLGGETHTFTRVKRFGGGLVAPLNTPGWHSRAGAGMRTNGQRQSCSPAPSPDNIFIPAGAGASAMLKSGETARFQRCIHPWMHVTITPQDEQHENVH